MPALTTLSPPTAVSGAAPSAAPVDLGTLDLAPMGRRLLAWLIDVGLFFGGFLAGLVSLDTPGRLREIARGLVTKSFDDALLKVTPLVVLAAVFLLGWAAYRVTGTALRGSSVGRVLAGVRVVDAADGTSRPGWGKAWARWGVPQAFGLIPVPGAGGIAYLWAVHDPHRRGLHDKAAGTVVIRRGGG